VPDPARCGDRLEPLLDRLLGEKADDAVGDLRIARELTDRSRILFGLS
jgi:hypothetical protein